MTELDLASDRVDEIADELDLSDRVTERANELAEAADFEYPINRSPNVVAAASVYLAGVLYNEKRYQHEISEIVDVSEAAIGSCNQELLKHEGYGDFSSEDTAADVAERDESLVRRIREVIRR